MKILNLFLTLVLFALLSCMMTIYANPITPNEDEYTVVVDKAPVPVGGFESLMKKVVYPETAMRMRVEGKVYLLVYVNESGEVDEVKVVKGIGGGCDEAAVNAIKKTKFSPGIEKGNPVKTKVSIPITFKLN